MTYPNRWTVGEWTFYEIQGHGFSGIEGSVYGFTVGLPGVGQRPKFTELYETLDEAMVAAVGEKYTGRRGAGGEAVGTAADWFLKMIGARKVYPASPGPSNHASATAWDVSAPKPPPDTSWINTEVRKHA